VGLKAERARQGNHGGASNRKQKTKTKTKKLKLKCYEIEG